MFIKDEKDLASSQAIKSHNSSINAILPKQEDASELKKLVSRLTEQNKKYQTQATDKNEQIQRLEQELQEQKVKGSQLDEQLKDIKMMNN